MHLASITISLANLTSSAWWVEVWVHLVFACSALTFILAPFEEWVHENCSTTAFKRVHSALELFRKYGALNKRPFLPRTQEAEGEQADQQAKEQSAGK